MKPVVSMVPLVLYLAPAAAIALALQALAGRIYLFSLLTISGTLTHELLHFLVGLVLGAKPVGFSLFPQKQGDSYTMGSVSFGNLAWYNAAPVALAPLLGIGLIFGVAWWRTAGAWFFSPLDLLLWPLLATQLLSFWPSATDWKLALRSWPIFLLFGAGVWQWLQFA